MAKPAIAPALMHGFIDPYAPGGLEQLFAFRRAQFGNAVMSAGAGGEGSGAGGGTGGDPSGAGAGDGGVGTGAAGAAGAAGTESGTDEQLGEGGKRALEAERAANKQLKADLAERDSKITAFENAGKTDEQKREQELADLRNGKSEGATLLAARELTILQYQVASAKGLDLSAAERLRGATKEEIEADADAWILKWGKSTGDGVVPGAGAAGSNDTDVAPGMARLRLGYSQSPKK